MFIVLFNYPKIRAHLKNGSINKYNYWTQMPYELVCNSFIDDTSLISCWYHINPFVVLNTMEMIGDIPAPNPCLRKIERNILIRFDSNGWRKSAQTNDGRDNILCLTSLDNGLPAGINDHRTTPCNPFDCVVSCWIYSCHIELIIACPSSRQYFPIDRSRRFMKCRWEKYQVTF